MGSPANSSSLITSKRNPWPLSLSACSQPSLLRLMPSPRLRLMPTMATMATVSAPMVATVPTATAIPALDTMARGPLMLRPPPLLRLLPLLMLRLMLMLSMATMDTPMPMDMVLATTDMPTTDMDMPPMPIPMPTLDTTARGLLMLRLPPLLMLTTATTATPAPTALDVVLGDLVTEVAEDVVQLSQHHGAVAVLVVQLEELQVVVVGALGVGGGDSGLALLHDIVVLGELLALLVGLSLGDTGLLGDVQTQSVHDVSEEEEINLAFAIPVVDVADVFDLCFINHFENMIFASLDNNGRDEGQSRSPHVLCV